MKKKRKPFPTKVAMFKPPTYLQRLRVVCVLTNQSCKAIPSPCTTNISIYTRSRMTRTVYPWGSWALFKNTLRHRICNSSSKRSRQSRTTYSSSSLNSDIRSNSCMSTLLLWRKCLRTSSTRTSLSFSLPVKNRRAGSRLHP